MNRRKFMMALGATVPAVTLGRAIKIEEEAPRKRSLKSVNSTLFLGQHEYRFSKLNMERLKSTLPKNTLYYHCEDFMREAINAIRKRRVEKWYDYVLSHRAMYIEDIHLLQNTEAIQDMMQYFVKKMSWQNKPILASAEDYESFLGNDLIWRDIRDFFRKGMVIQYNENQLPQILVNKPDLLG